MFLEIYTYFITTKNFLYINRSKTNYHYFILVCIYWKLHNINNVKVSSALWNKLFKFCILKKTFDTWIPTLIQSTYLTWGSRKSSEVWRKIYNLHETQEITWNSLMVRTGLSFCTLLSPRNQCYCHTAVNGCKTIEIGVAFPCTEMMPVSRGVSSS